MNNNVSILTCKGVPATERCYKIDYDKKIIKLLGQNLRVVVGNGWTIIDKSRDDIDKDTCQDIICGTDCNVHVDWSSTVTTTGKSNIRVGGNCIVNAGFKSTVICNGNDSTVIATHDCKISTLCNALIRMNYGGSIKCSYNSTIVLDNRRFLARPTNIECYGDKSNIIADDRSLCNIKEYDDSTPWIE